MVEEVMLTYLHCGFDPLLHLQTQTNYYEKLFNRNFEFSCTDRFVSVWLCCIDSNDITNAAVRRVRPGWGVTDIPCTPNELRSD